MTTLTAWLESMRDMAAQTPLTHLPGVRTAYDSVVNCTVPQSPVWIDYSGYKLLIQPTEHVGRRLWTGNGWENGITAVIESTLSNGDVAMDIGAHYGLHALTMRRQVGEAGRVFAFEPNPSVAHLIRRTFSKNGFENVEHVEKALTNTTNDVTLVEESRNTGHATTRPAGEKGKEFTVQATTFSEFLSSRGVDNIDLLKVDIEGGEADLIPTIDFDAVETLVLELHGEYLPGSAVEEVLYYLRQHGTVQFVGENDKAGRLRPLSDAPKGILKENFHVVLT